MDTNTDNKPYDLTEIKAMCDDNISFFERLLAVFMQTLDTELANIKEGAATGNWEMVGKAAHKIKPSLIHFHVTLLKDVIFGLERHENVDAARLQSLVVELEKVITDVLVNLKAEFPHVG
jgi:HPt (histidine-containing phosphotransfer) domain-containing protein